MAKKKKKEDEGISSTEDLIKKKFGDVIVSGNYVISRPKQIVSVSPMFDAMLGGGIPFGSFVIPTGPAKAGKTSFSLDMAGSALGVPTDFSEPRHLYFFSIEGRLQPRDLKGITGLAPYLEDRVHVIESKPGNILSAEKFLDIGETLINNKPGSIFIFDSFSQLCSQQGMDKEWDSKAYRDNVPAYLSQFCKRISNVIPINQSIVVGITHQIANTGFGFSSWAEASGNKIQYAVDVKLKANFAQPWKDGETKIGQDVNWECFCSPLHNGPTETKCVSKLRYGEGIDKRTELINVCVDLGIIKKGGAWYTITDETETEHKFQGVEKGRELLLQNPATYNFLNTQYREMMGLSQ